MDQLLRTKSKYQSKLRRLTSAVKKTLKGEITEIDIIQLSQRLNDERLLLKEFENVCAEIEQATEEELNEDLDKQTEEFEIEFYDTTSKIQHIIEKGIRKKEVEKVEKIEEKVESKGTEDPVQLKSTVESIKLPTVKLPTFTGNFEEWFEFRDAFESLVHNNSSLTDIEKFYHLLSCVKHEAAQSLRSLTVTTENYKAAWDLLKRRFENKKLIVQSNIRALFELESVKRDTHANVQNYLDSILNIVHVLKNYEEPSADTLLIHILTSKLSLKMRQDWEINCSNIESPKLEQLTEFLERKCIILGSLEVAKCGDNSMSYEKSRMKHQHSKVLVSVPNPVIKCPICNGEHNIVSCDEFLKLSIAERINQARHKHLCLNCLKKYHFTKKCRAPPACTHCSKKHNSLLHLVHNSIEFAPSNNTTQSIPIQSNSGETTSIPIFNNDVVCTSQIKEHQISQVILSTALVFVRNKDGNLIECRALLDPGAQTNFITSDLCNRLGLRKMSYAHKISGISNSISSIQHKTAIHLKSRINNYFADLNCLILDQIVSDLPNVSFNLHDIEIPIQCELADPKFNISSKIDLLIGAELFWQLLSASQINLGKGKPILHKTILGWVVGGKLTRSYANERVVACSINATLSKQIERFWELDQCLDNEKPYSDEEKECEEHFQKTTTRTSCGRFIVRLPLKTSVMNLGDSKEMATKRFLNLEHKLNQNEILMEQYSQFLREYEELGHMSKVPENDINETHYYLPHHGVIREDSLTTKLRVVFDASAKTKSGVSINDIQCAGPAIQGDLISILMRFREHTYALKADISKMYRQVLLSEDQRNLQLILWRPNKSSPIHTYRLNTVTYGMKAAPFLAVRCLKQLGDEARQEYPTAETIIANDFYVDDLVTGANCLQDLQNIQYEISSILAKGGFELRKWASNCKEFLDKICTANKENTVNLLDKDSTKTLGLSWEASSDVLTFSIGNSKKMPQEITKRSILSLTAKIFDPLGLLSPITIVPKLIIQKLCQLKITWDEAIPADLYYQWTEFRKQLQFINEIRIDRSIVCIKPALIELHGFSDASEKALGACVYLRSINGNGTITVRLISAKSKVAPLKTVSLPRLELCGATLLAKLMTKVQSSLKLEISASYYWCDSSITLSWIWAQPNRWTTFVANRVSEVQSLSDKKSWHHVRSHDNPADLISRGTTVTILKDRDLWWYGPDWLQRDSSEWPRQQPFENVTTVEAKACSAVIRSDEFRVIKRLSSLEKLKRVIAYCRRFALNCKLKKNERNTGEFSSDDLKTALLCLIRVVQNNEYSNEMTCLVNRNQVSSKSSLLSLNPFVDSTGRMRVGGRLSQSNYSYDKRHPIILPSSNELTERIARSEHVRLLHCGPGQLLASLRENFWIIRGRNFVRKITHACFICSRNRPKILSPIMGNLPETRITPSPPFSNSGVDYAGPILVKSKRGRGAKLTKAYICIFVCFATKAVHLEVASDLTTEEFLAALRRFISRRGLPINLYSDNGTNFTGAKAELQELGKFLSSHEAQRQISNSLLHQNINWHLIPARSPHFGGIWEAGVKSTKYHLRRIVGNSSLTFNELYTLLTQIEAVLNSRPLYPLSPDPNDFEPLTPGHFLIGRRLTSFPEVNNSKNETSLQRYERVQAMMHHFWKRWAKEYISELQGRSKWKKHSTSHIKVDQLVVLREENLPPFMWKLGRVVSLHPGQDGVTRVVSIKCANGNIIKRALAKIAVLQAHEN